MNDYITILLATFTNNEYLDTTVRKIYNTFQIEHDKIFIFNIIDFDIEGRKLLTYNVFAPKDSKIDINKVFHTIRINRKKESNTLYTINSVNKIIESKIGHVDPKYKIDWMEYENKLLLFDVKKGLQIHDTTLNHIITRTFFFKNNTALNIEQNNTNNSSNNNNNPQRFNPITGRNHFSNNNNKNYNK